MRRGSCSACPESGGGSEGLQGWRTGSGSAPAGWGRAGVVRGMEGQEAKRRRRMEQSRSSSQERRAQDRRPQEPTAGWTLRALPSGQLAPGGLPPLNPDYRRRCGGTSQSQGCLCFSNPRQSRVFLHPGLADAPGPPGPCHTHSPPQQVEGPAQGGCRMEIHSISLRGTESAPQSGMCQALPTCKWQVGSRPREGKGPTQVTQQWRGEQALDP